MIQKKFFEEFKQLEIKEPIANDSDILFQNDLVIYKKSYKHLQSKLENCIYVELSFGDSSVDKLFWNKKMAEADILCSDEAEMIVLQNLKEEVWDWEKFTQDFANIEYLIIRNCKEISKSIFNIDKIIYIELFKCELNTFCFDNITKLYKLETLSLNCSKIRELPEIISKIKSLKVLSVTNTDIQEFADFLKHLVNLRYLNLIGTKINFIPTIIGKLKNITHLYLGGTNILTLPVELEALTKMKALVLTNTQLESLPDWICSYKNLKELYTGRNKKLQRLPKNIGDLVNLEVLYLNETGLSELPESFGNLQKLKELSLTNTNIRKFPVLKMMNNLSRCDLSNMILERIPKELIGPKIEILPNFSVEGLHIDNTKLLCQPISLFSHEKEFIYAYYEEEKIHLNETKVVFLGDGEAGKSHIIERILTDNQLLAEFKEESTPGISISQKLCVIDKENIRLQIWDFGGQEIMHSMHRFFLTERTLYVIVINARDNTQDERAEYWLNNVKNFANGCPVIIVLNKMDQNPAASINERLLRSDYPQIVQILKMSALKDTSEDFGKLMKNIVESVKKFDSYAMDFPVSWNKIKTTLEDMDSNYIMDREYRKICKQNSVEDEQIQNWLLDWFHDLGISFNYYKKDRLLGGYMVLKPTWITNAIYIILFNGNKYARNGLIEINDIITLLKNPPKSVESINYDIEEVPYILGVMRRFEISYSIDKDNEFIPMMCDKNQHEDAEIFMNSDCMEYYMEYEYLPNNVLHKLMIKMQNDFDKNKIWLTGMILHSRQDNISALVRMHDKRIEIFIKSLNSRIYSPKEYLSEIRQNLLNINKELNLKAKGIIVYKEDDRSENIDYDILLIHLSSGENEYFSPVFHKRILIRKILGMVENEIDIDLIISYCKENKDATYSLISHMLMNEHIKISYNELEEDILQCGLKIQGDTLMILKGKENDRNTYFRNMLSANKQYIINDQTLNGTSNNQKAAGELDLLIKNSKKMPIAIIEALTLSYVNKNYIAEHIDKLFLYDTWGLPNNYILVYVENHDFAKFKKTYKDYISQYEYKYPVKYLRVKEREKYAEMAVFDVEILRNEKESKITHILLHMQNV